MNAVVEARRAIPTLQDPKLFREHCYIDGLWVESDSRKRIDDTPYDLAAQVAAAHPTTSDEGKLHTL